MSAAGRLWTSLRAIVYASAFFGLWIWLAYRVHLDDRLGGYIPGWARGVGWILMIVGAAIALVCVGTFVIRGGGTPAPFDPPREFVATGPYRWVRNPMYVGFFLFLAGYALCAGSLSALLVAFGMVVAAHLFVIVYEEPTLERTFGDTYREYRRATPRWIPRAPKRG